MVVRRADGGEGSAGNGPRGLFEKQRHKKWDVVTREVPDGGREWVCWGGLRKREWEDLRAGGVGAVKEGDGGKGCGESFFCSRQGEHEVG